MPQLGVNVAIIHEGLILLMLREDFPVWCLPGGGMEDGESVAQAAVREVREETGLDVELTRLVGVYSQPKGHMGGNHGIVFVARVVGGTLQPQASEARDLRYFMPEALPDNLVWTHRQRIMDAFKGVGGSVAYTQHFAPPFPQATRAELYAMRDRGELTPQMMYEVLCVPPTESETLEVGNR